MIKELLDNKQRRREIRENGCGNNILCMRCWQPWEASFSGIKTTESCTALRQKLQITLDSSWMFCGITGQNIWLDVEETNHAFFFKLNFVKFAEQQPPWPEVPFMGVLVLKCTQQNLSNICHHTQLVQPDQVRQRDTWMYWIEQQCVIFSLVTRNKLCAMNRNKWFDFGDVLADTDEMRGWNRF